MTPKFDRRSAEDCLKIGDKPSIIAQRPFTGRPPAVTTITGMRSLLLSTALFVYVCADITVNNGAALRGWVSLVSHIAKSVATIG
jgi:hypothetical protein